MVMHRKLRFSIQTFLLLALLIISPVHSFGEEILVAHPALTFGDVPYYIAKEKGFYRDEGIQVKDLYIRGGVTASQALQAGSVHFTLALGTGVRAALSGMNIKAIMVYCDKPYHFLYARPDLGVRSAAELRGKRVAVTGLGATTGSRCRQRRAHRIGGRYLAGASGWSGGSRSNPATFYQYGREDGNGAAGICRRRDPAANVRSGDFGKDHSGAARAGAPLREGNAQRIAIFPRQEK
jgi:ABC-type nitrate/sulfonate/bicarbonate transport system substrate-binding protein